MGLFNRKKSQTDETDSKVKKESKSSKKVKKHIESLKLNSVAEDSFMDILENEIKDQDEKYVISDEKVTYLLGLNNQLLDNSDIVNMDQLARFKKRFDLSNRSLKEDGSITNATFMEDLNKKYRKELIISMLPTNVTLKTLAGFEQSNPTSFLILTIPSDLNDTNIDDYIENEEINAIVHDDNDEPVTVTLEQFKEFITKRMGKSDEYVVDDIPDMDEDLNDNDDSNNGPILTLDGADDLSLDNELSDVTSEFDPLAMSEDLDTSSSPLNDDQALFTDSFEDGNLESPIPTDLNSGLESNDLHSPFEDLSLDTPLDLDSDLELGQTNYLEDSSDINLDNNLELGQTNYLNDSNDSNLDNLNLDNDLNLGETNYLENEPNHFDLSLDFGNNDFNQNQDEFNFGQDEPSIDNFNNGSDIDVESEFNQYHDYNGYDNQSDSNEIDIDAELAADNIREEFVEEPIEEETESSKFKKDILYKISKRIDSALEGMNPPHFKISNDEDKGSTITIQKMIYNESFESETDSRKHSIKARIMHSVEDELELVTDKMQFRKVHKDMIAKLEDKYLNEQDIKSEIDKSIEAVIQVYESDLDTHIEEAVRKAIQEYEKVHLPARDRLIKNLPIDIRNTREQELEKELEQVMRKYQLDHLDDINTKIDQRLDTIPTELKEFDRYLETRVNDAKRELFRLIREQELENRYRPQGYQPNAALNQFKFTPQSEQPVQPSTVESKYDTQLDEIKHQLEETRRSNETREDKLLELIQSMQRSNEELQRKLEAMSQEPVQQVQSIPVEPTVTPTPQPVEPIQPIVEQPVEQPLEISEPMTPSVDPLDVSEDLEEVTPEPIQEELTQVTEDKPKATKKKPSKTKSRSKKASKVNWKKVAIFSAIVIALTGIFGLAYVIGNSYFSKMNNSKANTSVAAKSDLNKIVLVEKESLKSGNAVVIEYKNEKTFENSLNNGTIKNLDDYLKVVAKDGYDDVKITKNGEGYTVTLTRNGETVASENLN